MASAASKYLTVSLVLLSSSSLFGCDQPEPRCRIAQGEFAARYTLVSSTGPCGDPLHSEFLSVQAYTAPRSASDRRPDYDKTSIGIQPSTLSGLLFTALDRAEPNPEDKPYGFGAFSDSHPAGDDFCTVPTLNVARVRLPALPEKVTECSTLPAEPAADVSYAFSNVRVYVTAGAYGTQFAADLTYTNGECVAQYKVAAVYPAIPCGSPIEPVDPDGGQPAPMMNDIDASTLDAGAGDPALLDADLTMPDAGPTEPNPDCLPPEEEHGPEMPDDSVCASAESGLNPDFALSCDPTLLHCILTGEPPSLR